MNRCEVGPSNSASISITHRSPTAHVTYQGHAALPTMWHDCAAALLRNRATARHSMADEENWKPLQALVYTR